MVSVWVPLVAVEAGEMAGATVVDDEGSLVMLQLVLTKGSIVARRMVAGGFVWVVTASGTCSFPFSTPFSNARCHNLPRGDFGDEIARR